MKLNTTSIWIVCLSLFSLTLVIEALPQQGLARRQIFGGAADASTSDAAASNGGQGNGGGNAGGVTQSSTKDPAATSSDQTNPTTRNDNNQQTTQAQQQTTQQAATTQAQQTTTVQPVSTATPTQIVTPTVISSSSKISSSSSSSSKPSSSSVISSITKLSVSALPSSSLSFSASSLSSSMIPSASAAPDTSDTTQAGLAKKTIIIIIVVASVLGLAFGAWTIYRKTKLGPSARFEEKLQPIDWSPTAGESDAVYLKEMNSDNDSNSMHDSSAHPHTAEYYPYLGRSPSGRTIPDQAGAGIDSNHESIPYGMSNIAEHGRTMSGNSGLNYQGASTLQPISLQDGGGLPYDNESPVSGNEVAHDSHQYESYPTMNPSEYGGVGTFQSFAGRPLNGYGSSQEVGTMSRSTAGSQYNHSNYYEVPYTGPMSHGGGTIYGRGGQRGYPAYDESTESRAGSGMI